MEVIWGGAIYGGGAESKMYNFRVDLAYI
jgi:hypothetical protein